MAMVRAVLTFPRPPSSSPVFLRVLRLSSSAATALVIPASRQSSQDIAEEKCVGDASELSCKAHQEHSVKAEADLRFESGLSKLRASIWRQFLNEQTDSLNELRYQLKDQGTLLSLIQKEVTSCKLEFKTRKNLVGNAVSVSSQTNPEAILEFKTSKDLVGIAASVSSQTYPEGILEPANELCDAGNMVQLSHTRSTLCDRTSENGGPVLPGKSSKNDASLAKKRFDIEKFQHPPWREWALFLDHLRPHASMKEWKPSEEARTDEIFDDTALLKHALVKFAQAHEAAFRTLSRKDLLVVVQHEFPSMDERTAAGKRRLQNYLEMDESRVAEVKLTDVVRLIYRAIRSAPSLGGALPNELKSAIVHILEDLNSASSLKPDGITSHLEKTPFVLCERTQGAEQKTQLAKVDETETSSDMIKMVGEAVLPMKFPSINQDESTLKTTAASTLLEVPKFGSLKERVDARRARLARESLEKEAAKALEPSPLLTKELALKTITKSTQMDKKKDDCVVVRNFKAFDSIIDSDDSDGGIASESRPKPVSRASLSSSVQKKVKPFTFLNKGIQTYNGQQKRLVRGKHREEDDFSLESRLIHDKEDADENGSAGESEGGQDVGGLQDEEWSSCGSEAESEDETGSEGEVGAQDGCYVRGRGGRIFYSRGSIAGKNGCNHG
eukprot:c19163_g1_i2 orf=622-2631(-)